MTKPPPRRISKLSDGRTALFARTAALSAPQTSCSGKTDPHGLYQAAMQCLKPFTAAIGTVLRAPAISRCTTGSRRCIFFAQSKKGDYRAISFTARSAFTLQTAWFMAHRIREAMSDTESWLRIGGNGKTVEIDETVFGRIEGAPPSTRKMGGRSGFRHIALTLGGARRIGSFVPC